METPILPHRTPIRMAVGEKSAFTRTFTQADVSLFIGVTWDVNPLHTDDEYVKETPFKTRIVPGLLTASLFTHIGGLWAFAATEMDLHFTAPVYIGDTVTAEIEIVELDEQRGWVRLSARCSTAQGKQVLHAQITGYPGRFAALP